MSSPGASSTYFGFSSSKLATNVLICLTNSCFLEGLFYCSDLEAYFSKCSWNSIMAFSSDSSGCFFAGASGKSITFIPEAIACEKP